MVARRSQLGNPLQLTLPPSRDLGNRFWLMYTPYSEPECEVDHTGKISSQGMSWVAARDHYREAYWFGTLRFIAEGYRG